MDKDRYKSAILKRPKGKALPPSNLIALGKQQSRASGSDGDSGPSRKFTSSPLSDRKREASAPVAAPSVIKKPKLLSQTFTPLGRNLDDRRASPATRQFRFEEVAIEVENEVFVKELLSADRSDDDERVEGLLCGAARQLRVTRYKPDQCLYLGLMYVAKRKPALFTDDLVMEAFCHLLKREVSMSFKSKGNPLVSVLTCNVLMLAYAGESNWPDQFVKVYAEDSLGERLWVDRKDCALFVANITTAFSTKLPPEETMLSSGDASRVGDQSGSASPVVMLADDDENTMDMDTVMLAAKTTDDHLDSDIEPRFGFQKSVIESFILEFLSEQLSRRGNVDVSVRNLVRLMMATCCYSEVRLMAAQRLEMWLMNNAKMNKCAQDLLMTVCMNCDQNDKKDTEVIIQLLKIRLKTKPLINHYLLCMRELVIQNSSNLQTILVHTIYNELSNSRNPNNMAVLQALFQYTPEEASTVLADIFQDLLSNRDDYLRALRALLREIVRTMRPDLNFITFCRGIMSNRREKKFIDMEAIFKERYILSIADLVTLCMLLGVTSQIREIHAAIAKGDNREAELLVQYQDQVAEIQRDCVWWMHVSVPVQCTLKQADYLHCLHKLLFMENIEHYHNKDNWPPESDRGIMLRIASEAPVVEDTLLRVMIVGLEQNVTATDAMEICDQLVRRAAALHGEGRVVLKINKIEIIDALFNLSKYNYPDNIVLPKGYKPPDLAISAHYWKAWTILLLITAYNPEVFGCISWKNVESPSYETLNCLIEMVITNNYKFPPPTLSSDEKVLEDMKTKERMVCEEEKQLILEFESYLAAATTKVSITELNSLLLSTLISLDPNGIARRPPQQVLDQIKSLGVTHRLRQLLCKSRNPDFLLDIIQRQGTSQSMPWLANLVESSEGSFDVLPVQCLCEFLLMESGQDDASAHKTNKAEKHEALLRRMQSLVCTPEADATMSAELLTYFLCRLSSQQTSARIQATKGLSMILDTTMLCTTNAESPVAGLFPKQRWLLSCLPSLPIFDLIREDAMSAIRKALEIESDPPLLGSYIISLSDHTKHLDIQDLDDIVLDLSTLIVERTTVMNFLLPMEPERRSPASDAILSAFVSIYMNYVKKAQQPDQTYTWSNIQDQIRLQWKSGVSATMRVLVVHAMIILLTYSHKGDENEELLNTWFPANQQPPSAYLLDTSEEALLLPDFLKLRMIRSSSERVVNAALQDVDPSQLLLFVQSFGIPVSSMSQLLRCLDDASTREAGALRECIVDTGYMLQLVAIQQSRGATGGNEFARFLSQGKNGDQSAEEEGMDLTVDTPTPDIWARPTEKHTDLPGAASFDALTSYLLQLFTSPSPTNYKEMYKNIQLTSGVSDCKSLQPLVVSAIKSILTTNQRGKFVQGMEKNSGLAAIILRMFCITKGASDRGEVTLVLRGIEGLCSDMNGCVYKLVNKHCAKVAGAESGARVKVEAPERSLGEVTADLSSMVKTGDPRLEKTLGRFMNRHIRTGDIKPAARVACELLLSTPSQNQMLSHLLTDWLELLDPEVVSCVPELQREILFGKQSRPSHLVTPDARTSDVTVVDHSGETDVGGSKPPAYLLSILTHHSSWPTLLRCIDVLLNEHEKYDPTTVLDFLWACYNNPKIWQGRDKAQPMNYSPEDVFRFTAKQLETIVEYLVSEAKQKSASCSDPTPPDVPAATPLNALNPRIGTPETVVSEEVPETKREIVADKSKSDAVFGRSVTDRINLLKCCVCDNDTKLKAIVDYMQAKIRDKHPDAGSYLHLLTELYIHWPYLLCWLDDTNLVATSDAMSSHCSISQIDAISHRLIITLTNARPGKTSEARICDANIACRKLASQHPSLFLRQLPMLSALLKGHTGYSLPEMRHRKLLQLFTHILGLFELLEPLIFRTQFSGLEDTLDVYFDLMRVHGLEQRTLLSLIVKFVGFLHRFINICPQRAARLLQKYVPLLSDLSMFYPDLAPLKSILAALTLPHHNAVAAPPDDAESDPQTARPMSPWSVGQLAPFHKRLQKSASYQDIFEVLHELDEISKRKVNILSHFLDDLKRLMTVQNERCRTLAHNLMMRYVRHCPHASTSILPTFLHCLDSDDVTILSSALTNLAEFTGLCQDHASLLLQRAFTAGIKQSTDTVAPIIDSFHMLNTFT